DRGSEKRVVRLASRAAAPIIVVLEQLDVAMRCENLAGCHRPAGAGPCLTPQPDDLDRKHAAERHKDGRHQPYEPWDHRQIPGSAMRQSPLDARIADLVQPPTPE